MKRLYLFLLIVVAALMIGGTCSASAGDVAPTYHAGTIAYEYHDYFEKDGVWYIIAKKPDGGRNGEVYAGGCKSYVKKLVIPAVVEYSRKKYTVLGINGYAFSGEANITSIEIKEGITYIGERAFSRCSNLSRIKFPSSVDKVETCAFSECDAITRATTPANLKEIPAGMFSRCSGLKEVVIGKNTERIGTNAFYFCKALTKVKLNKSLKTVGSFAFQACDSLKNIKLPNGLTSVEDGAFYYCIGLEKITIPKKVKKIPDKCFEECVSLKKVKLPSALTAIGESAFCGCKELEDLTGKIRKLKTIGNYAFDECEKLKGFPGNNTVLKSIGEYAFGSCKALGTFVFGGRLKEIAHRAFYMSGIPEANLPESLKTLGTEVFLDCRGLKEAYIPGSIESIPEGTFERCYYLEKVSIGEGTKEIGFHAFMQCYRMFDFEYPKTIDVVHYAAFDNSGWFEYTANGAKGYSDTSGFTYGRWDSTNDYSDFEEFVCINDVCICAQTSEVQMLNTGKYGFVKKDRIIFPKHVKCVSCYVHGTSDIKQIVLPEGVEKFYGKIRLDKYFDCKNLVLPSTLREINGWIGGDGLTEIKLPEGLEIIGDNAFAGSTGLTSIEFPEGIKKIGLSAFQNTGIKEFTLPDNFLIEEDFSYEEEMTFYVKKNSPAHKALKKFINEKKLDGWKIKFK